MNYYEELGIEPSATEEEIARAHRRLAKLMHPDQQVDDAVKKLAETQMRRLNAIVEVLTDPGKRRLYDEQLQAKAVSMPLGNAGVTQPTKPTPASFHAAPPPSAFAFGLRNIWRALPWWVWSTGGALVMTFAISWMVADYSGSSFDNRATDYVRPKDDTDNKDKKQVETSRPFIVEHPKRTALAALNRILAAMAAEKPAVPAPKPPAVKNDVKNDQPQAAQIQAAQTQAAPPSHENSNGSTSDATKTAAQVKQETPPVPIAGVPETERLNARASKGDNVNSHPVETAAIAAATPAPAIPKPASKPASAPLSIPTASIPAPRSEAPTAKPALSVVATAEAKDPLAGDWIYAPAEPEKPTKGYFPPEFIELRLVSQQGLLHGEYKARYQVKNAPLRPDVSFQVIASAANSNRFSWESSDGRKGILKITQVDAKNIEVEWKTTTKSRVPALNVGSATLTRKNIE